MPRPLSRMTACVSAALLAFGVGALPSFPAIAANCPGAAAGGPAIGWIEARGTRVPIKLVHFRNGGDLTPPPSSKVAGLTAEHASLDATAGTSVLTWHSRFGVGCPGSLNDLMRMPVGSTFQVGLKGQPAQTFEITGREVVPKGEYRDSWFRDYGPHRLAMFTCTGLRQGVFRDTMAVFATRVPVD